MGLYTPLVKLFHKGEPMAIMTFWILLTGTGWLLLISGYQMLTLDWQAIAGPVWGGIIYLAVFTTIITFFISQWATMHIGPTKVMSYSFLYPPIIVVFEFFLGYGLPPLRTLLGVFVIIASMVIIQREVTQK